MSLTSGASRDGSVKDHPPLETGNGVRQDPERLEFCADGFVTTAEHRRFEEVCQDARRYRHVALCVGAPGVGKSYSGRRYSAWDLVEPLSSSYAHIYDPPSEVSSRRAAYYMVPAANTPKLLDAEIDRRRGIVSWLVDVAENPESEDGGLISVEDRTELVIIDEAQFLKNTALEQLRYIYDQGDFGLVLMGMPGLDKILSRYRQFYSRVGRLHYYKPLTQQPVRELLRKPSVFRVGLTAESFSEEAAVALMRHSQGNFRTLKMLAQRVERLLEINGLDAANAEVVRLARDQLLLGQA